jgi:hypothetical protein
VNLLAELDIEGE